MSHNQNHGIIISNHSLVLQKVTRGQAGSYTCEASNVEGDEVSNPVSITIMCESKIENYSLFNLLKMVSSTFANDRLFFWMIHKINSANGIRQNVHRSNVITP